MLDYEFSWEPSLAEKFKLAAGIPSDSSPILSLQSLVDNPVAAPSTAPQALGAKLDSTTTDLRSALDLKEETKTVYDQDGHASEIATKVFSGFESALEIVRSRTTVDSKLSLISSSTGPSPFIALLAQIFHENR